MQAEKLNLIEAPGASVATRNNLLEGASVFGVFTAVCIGPDGEVKWEEVFKNLVMNAGKQDLLNKYFTGSSYTAAWYLGLVNGSSTPTYNAADTSGSHSGWTEFTAYSQSTRPAVSFSAATSSGGGAGSAGTGSITNSSSPSAFSINGSGGTVAGAFLISNNVISGTTGTLFSAGNFTTGSRTVLAGDTLNVTYTANC